MNIAVYLGSNPGRDPVYLACAEEIGALIASGGHTLVYGGSESGMMGVLAGTVTRNGGHAIGVIPQFFMYRVFQGLTELYTVQTMAERKQKMIELADAYIALPGGPGTIEEISEVISCVRIGLFAKPCVIYSRNGYYEPLKQMYDRMVQQGFLTREERDRFVFADSIEEVRKTLGI
jgi:hypothetical protein